MSGDELMEETQQPAPVPPQSETVPGPTYDNPNEEQQADETESTDEA